MFINQKVIAHITMALVKGSNAINNGNYRYKENDIHICREITSGLEGFRIFIGTKRLPTLIRRDELLSDIPGSKVEGLIWAALGNVIREQAISTLTAALPNGHPSAPAEVVVAHGIKIVALPTSEPGFTQITVTDGKSLLALYTTTNDIHYSNAWADAEEVVIRKLVTLIKEGDIELDIK